MNVKEYISSGILEDYLLGNASEQEQREVKCLSSIYPEIQKALDEKSKELELVSSHYAVQPPEELKGQILSAIAQEEQEEETAEKETKVEPLPLEQPTLGDKITPSVEKPERTNRFMWIGIAASIAVLLMAFWVYFSMDQDYENQMAALERENNELEQEIEQLAHTEQQLKNLTSPHMNRVPLEAVAEGSPQQALVFWNSEDREVFLNAEGLKAPPEGMQYQLWALKDGSPIDLGVFDLPSDQSLATMKEVESADAFAITLEPAGGNPQPTMDQLQVMGEVKG